MDGHNYSTRWDDGVGVRSLGLEVSVNVTAMHVDHSPSTRRQTDSCTSRRSQKSLYYTISSG